MDNLRHLLWIIAAGASGGILGLKLPPKQRTLVEKVTFVFYGLLVAFWVTPMLCKRWHLTDIEDITAIALAAGAFWGGVMAQLGSFVLNFKSVGQAKND